MASAAQHHCIIVVAAAPRGADCLGSCSGGGFALHDAVVAFIGNVEVRLIKGDAGGTAVALEHRLGHVGEVGRAQLDDAAVPAVGDET